MRHKKIAATTAAVLALGGAGAGIAMGVGAGGGGDGAESGPPPTRAQADAAVAAALRATGGGEANAVERDGENGATWEVEVTKPDGQTADVRLGSALDVIVIEADAEDANGRGPRRRSAGGRPTGAASGAGRWRRAASRAHQAGSRRPTPSRPPAPGPRCR